MKLDLGELQVRGELGLRSREQLQAFDPRRDGGHDESPFAERVLAPKLAVFDVAMAGLPGAMKFLDAPAKGVRGDDLASLREVLHAEFRQEEPVERLLSGRAVDHLACVDRGDLHLTALAGRRVFQRNEHVHGAKRDVRDAGRAARAARELYVVPSCFS